MPSRARTIKPDIDFDTELTFKSLGFVGIPHLLAHATPSLWDPSHGPRFCGLLNITITSIIIITIIIIFSITIIGSLLLVLFLLCIITLLAQWMYRASVLEGGTLADHRIYFGSPSWTTWYFELPGTWIHGLPSASAQILQHPWIREGSLHHSLNPCMIWGTLLN